MRARSLFFTVLIVWQRTVPDMLRTLTRHAEGCGAVCMRWHSRCPTVYAPTTSLKKLIARDELLADHASDAYHREAAII